LVDTEGGLTLTGDVVGTPAYMSPEQVRAGKTPPDARSDVYSLGATLYEVLTLKAPFRGRAPADVMLQIVTRDPAPPRRWEPRIPRDLETVVLKCLEKDPAARYARAADLARDLRAVAEGSAVRARRLGPLGRAWRVVRRRPARAALVAATLVLAGASALLLARLGDERAALAAEEARRKDLEYVHLTASAQEAATSGRDLAPGETPPEQLARAIRLLPDRYEAYLGRVLYGGSSKPSDLEDLAAAEKRGAPRRAVRMLRAVVLRDLGHAAEAEAEEAAALQEPGDDPDAKVTEAHIALAHGEPGRSLALLDEAISAAPGAASAYAARQMRWQVRRRTGDFHGALEDLHVLVETAGPAPRLVLATAQTWRALGQPEKAREIWQGLLAQVRTKGTREEWVAFVEFLNASPPEMDWMEEAAREGLAAWPGTPRLLARLGWAVMMQERLDEALGIAEEAVALAPDLHEAQALLGRVRVRRREPGAAIEPLRRAVALGQGCSTCSVNLAMAYRNLERFDEASEAVTEALRRSPANADAHAERAWVLHVLGKPDEALEAAERALEIEPRNVGALNVFGDLVSRRGRLDEALEASDLAIAVEPGDVATYYNRGQALYRNARYADAVKDYDRALALDDRRAEIHGQRGLALLFAGELEPAAKAIRRAEALDPRDAFYPNNLSHVLLALGRWQEALDAAERSIALDARDAAAHTNRAGALAGLGRTDDARIAAEVALGLDETWVEAWTRLGQAHLMAGDAPRAVAAFRRALALAADDLNALHGLGLALLRTGARDEGMELLARALQRGRRAPDVAADVAWWLLHRPDRTEESVRRALSFAESAVEQAPTLPNGWSTLGAARYHAGDLPGAIEALERSVEQTPGVPDPWVGLYVAMALAREGNAERSREWYRRALESDADLASKPAWVAAVAEAAALVGEPPPSRSP
jgi:tetratricopeptide (TPR) repeat protein